MLDPQPREKILNVLVDRLKMLASLVGQLFSDKNAKRQQSVKSSDTGTHDQRHQWNYKSSVSIDESLFRDRASEFKQDHYENGYCVSDYDYDIVKLHNAVQYTDGATHRSIYNTDGRIESNLSSVNGRLKPAATVPHSPKLHMPGLSANLFGTVAMANGNYGHWLIDGLSRYFLIEQFFDPEDIQRYIVPVKNYPFHQEMLNSLGITHDKVVELTPMVTVSYDQLICTSAPRGYSSSITPGWVIDKYRERLLPFTATSTLENIYVSRKDSAIRQIANEDELAGKLEDYGFETVVLSDYNFTEKAALFNGATNIVGLSGAGFTNLMFCRQDARVLEIFPPNFLQYTLTSICSHLNLSHDYHVLQTSESNTVKNRYVGEIVVDIDQLTAKLDKMMG